MFKSLLISCDEATMICDKNQYGETNFFDKIKLQLHFIRCKICRLYTKQNMFLTKAYKDHAHSCSKQKQCMSEEDKDKLKKELEKQTI
ncbi:hypothetical protein OD91_1686 [Lutibacter sp. Hel_I_33_5]|uniref:hypothetical protein n=1 Tax=Lutibacter sp. Hel_I_33_5 TaxID=1566289 RepID=UPI00119CF906|nr:hypothetical protein [Lutibacter sp. Hel_I_33_5]TVZ56401.1 hypothetical protein OD91_1686 [Lutibacter sp. Hel_I_33_5]